MKTENKNLQPRPPIVVVMGHIDHGKTTLLDAIRKSEIAAKEAGGITQHIGAYEVEHEGKKITFIDTPGHEAFGKMRSRGVKVADIAILVVAADDGVKPQTKEALNVIKSSGTPYCVAINKIDKPAADVERVKNDLAHDEVFLEGRGGTVPVVEISAKSNVGLDQLLETILLLAELEDLKYDPGAFASGVVIESHLDPKRGITSTLLLIDGILKKNEYIVAGSTMTKTRIMENSNGKSLDSILSASPAVIVGFDTLPPVGAPFRTFFSQKEALDYQRYTKEQATASLNNSKKNNVKKSLQEDAQQEDTNVEPSVSIAIIIKSDTEGSGEALMHEIKKLQAHGFTIKILRIESGDVTKDDIALASSAEHPIIVAFRVAIKSGILELAKKSKVELIRFDIIYEVADYLKKRIEELLPPEVKRTHIGRAKIAKIFKGEAKAQLVGGKVIE
ncbi:MAG: translation initiation factor IF-2, partial [Patescibacteria group bacterium]